MKVGDLVRVKYGTAGETPKGTGIIVRFETYRNGEVASRGVPIVLINGKELIYGRTALEVISENR